MMSHCYVFYEYIYTIPHIPSSLNKFAGRTNTWQYRGEKKEWQEIVRAYCRPRPAKPLKRAVVEIGYYFPTAHRHDPDNYAGKMILDGLVSAGILEDDSFDHIELRLKKAGVDKCKPRTVIAIKGG